MSDDIIRLLPDVVANQIAAGEVVQRPASVIKELLENAIDAEATKIQVIITDAGRTAIQVIDNGKGMSSTDARMAFERHATSKIQKSEDLFSLHTKGFRGEALASIAAVAQVELKTKRDRDTLGELIKIQGSAIQDQKPIQAHNGTSITVKNLFYNVPARRNFLKSNQVEFKHIVDEFHRVALTHPEVALSLHHNQTEIFNLNTGNFRQRIVAIFGTKYNDKLVPITEETDIVKIDGYVLKPEFSKKKRGEQFFFVNNRFIKSQYLHYAVNEGFDNLLPNGYHPGYFIQLSIDPKHIDINIHPTKTEIKFDDDYTIFTFLRASIKHALGQYNIAPTLDFELQSDLAVPVLKKNYPIQSPTIRVDPTFNPFKETYENRPTSSEKEATQHFYASFQSKAFEETIEPDSKELEFETLPQHIQCMQWHQKYILYQAESGLWVIDQYRAHLRVLYEQYLIQLEKHNNLSQPLLFSLIVPCDATEMDTLRLVENELFSLGFHFIYLEDTIEINALPAQMQTEIVERFLHNLFNTLSIDSTIELDIKKNIALSMAKAAAIKRGIKLTNEEQINLLNQLFQSSNINYSPEGKSIFIQMPLDEIEKKLQ